MVAVPRARRVKKRIPRSDPLQSSGTKIRCR
jgi:hypothetical protein